jgi:hypothetical protein
MSGTNLIQFLIQINLIIGPKEKEEEKEEK